MVERDLKCQFRMDDVMDKDAECRNDAEMVGMSTRMEKSMRAVTKSKMMSRQLCASEVNHSRDSNSENCAKGSKSDGCDKKPLPCAAVGIPCKIDKYPVSNNGEHRGTSVVTTQGLRMAEAAGDIPIIIGGLGRCERHKTIYRTIGVAGQKDFRSGGIFLKDRAPQPAGDSVV